MLIKSFFKAIMSYWFLAQNLPNFDNLYKIISKGWLAIGTPDATNANFYIDVLKNMLLCFITKFYCILLCYIVKQHCISWKQCIDENEASELTFCNLCIFPRIWTDHLVETVNISLYLSGLNFQHLNEVRSKCRIRKHSPILNTVLKGSINTIAAGTCCIKYLITLSLTTIMCINSLYNVIFTL